MRTFIPVLVSILGIFGILVFGSRTIPHSSFQKAIYSGALQFDAVNAFSKMRTLSKSFPNRFTWTESRKNAAIWLKEELKRYGYTPRFQVFDETIAGKNYTDLENVFAEKTGEQFPDSKIVIAAHYDIAEGTTEGAMDDASGVGIVLELARIFRQIPTQHSIVFLFTDSEEYGNFWGARAFVKEHKDQLAAAINIDFIAPGHQTGILQLGDGIRKGFVPLWLRELGLGSLNKVSGFGEKNSELTGIGELIQRAILLPAADHGAFLAAGIPAINWVGQTDDFNSVMTDIHHTSRDVVEAMEVKSFVLPGRAAETLLQSIDRSPLLQTKNEFSTGAYWKLSESWYLDQLMTVALQLLLFLPFFFRTAQRVLAAFRKTDPAILKTAWNGEALRFLRVAFALLAGYAALLLLPGAGILTRYEEFPGTQKTPLLYSPDLLVILLLIAAGLLVYGLLRRFSGNPKSKIIEPELVHTFHVFLQAAITALAFAVNSHFAVMALLFPAYTWSFISNSKSRVLNSALLSLGPISFVAVLAYLTSIFHLGVSYWFLLLSASYGLILPITAILFLLSIALMGRIAVSIFKSRS
ncbi:MAG: hypothetical protein A2070_11390 [Bdellovibrionales bacterium GWC1_52_8]|nr:MAG: hypothetical protein A2Z97_02590 [Bdellovibrionales bacterium GWB1_52_6]OFZ03491.1 MAG: hypothetical protein A2X97_05965 [Bdellovibrionales bacterium GWA1_52_35]OFZ37953.1 MAG: hypothetical protein A2070_11390 [Bdellovibrionales bacterium GWC1_52_8]